MSNKHKPSAEEIKVVKTTEDLLADDRVAKYMRKQKLLVKLVKTKLGKVLFGKKFFIHEDILKKQDDLLNNLFGDRLDKIDSRYVDAIFLSYSKRMNKSKNPDALCMKGFYDSASRKLQKNNFDISQMQVGIDEYAVNQDDEGLFMSLLEYLNLLENIRVKFKEINTEYETKAKKELNFFEEEEVFTDYQAHSLADEIRNKKIEICSQEYDILIESEHMDPDFSLLCKAFYLAFKGNKNLDQLDNLLDMSSEITFEDIFFNDTTKEQVKQKKIPLEQLFSIFRKLLKENSSHMSLRNMYDIS